MFYHIIWNILLPEFIKNIIIYLIIKIKFKAYKTLIWNCYIDFKQLLEWKIKLWKLSYIGEEIRLNWNISIWSNTYIAWSWWEINASEKNHVNIWNFCSIWKNVFIISYVFHNSTKLTTSTSIPWVEYIDEWKEINIWNDVRIWANVTILPWVNIWNWVIIWAWSIVTKNIPDYAIAVWNPAKVIKYRFNEDEIEKINKLKWWNWDINKIKDYYNLEFINKI